MTNGVMFETRWRVAAAFKEPDLNRLLFIKAIISFELIGHNGSSTGTDFIRLVRQPKLTP
jgi:hypothetical protein